MTTALRKPAPVTVADALDRACLSARVAADNKGRDVLVLDMRAITPIYDYPKDTLLTVGSVGGACLLIHRSVLEKIGSRWFHHYQIAGDVVSLIPLRNRRQLPDGTWLHTRITEGLTRYSCNGVAAIWQALNALLEPILRPVRRLLPNTGAIDFSPLVVIIGLNILSMLLSGLARDIGY